MDYHPPILADKYYHVFSHANGNEKLFLRDENYRFFLSRMYSYITPMADILAYNLLPNHFHLIVDIKSQNDLLPLFKAKKSSNMEYDNWQPDFVIQKFSNFLNSYAKSFNKQNNRRGALFMNGIRRVIIDSDAQLSSSIFYVHKNAVHHGYCKNIADWKWSSYNELLSKLPTKLNRDFILEWFGNEARFIDFHTQPIHLKDAVIIEYCKKTY